MVGVKKRYAGCTRDRGGECEFKRKEVERKGS